MFIAIAVTIAVLMAVIEIAFINTNRKATEIIRVFIRNIFVIGTSCIAFQKFGLKYPHFISAEGVTAKQYLTFTIGSLIIGLILELVFSLVHNYIVFDSEKTPKHKVLSYIFRILAVVLFFLGCAAYFGTVWGASAFGRVTGDQLIINLTSPTEGTENSIYIEGYEGPVFQTLFATSIFATIVFSKIRLLLKRPDKETVTVFSGLAKRIVCFLIALGVLFGGLRYGYVQFEFDKVINAYIVKSDMIDKNYVNPKTADITFPEKKRNLIHIYLESMENSFMSEKDGGYLGENLIPNLTKLGRTGIVFSNSDKYFGGPLQGTGTQWSIASMINQTAGIPMKAPGLHNTYGAEGNFLPGAYTLGEILESQGYEQTIMFGASAEFGGLKYYYESHGNWKIIDYDNALKLGLLPKGYKEWWGYEDDKLYEFAKDEITRLYKTGKPFNFTMENADTHKPEGYVSKGKKMPYKSHYANALWNSDKDVCEFIKWIQEQPFYENTTVVLIGDHWCMDQDFFQKYYPLKKGYLRTQYNLILNPDPSVGKLSKEITNNRKWANWDYYPTIVASIGGKIEGDRLGIGTNLFSGKPTVFEENGVEEVNLELEKRSDLYFDEILGSRSIHNGTKFRVNNYR